jgi:HEXXH motif-containing protein
VTHFSPSVERAHECREAMDESLWSSIRDLLPELTDGQVTSGQVTGQSADSGSSAQPPEATNLLDYAAYFDLALAASAPVDVTVEAKSRAIEHLQNRLRVAARSSANSAPPRVTNYSEEEYTVHQLDQMRRWWDIEPANRMAMTRATDDEFARTRSQIEVAMDLLREAAPELHQEIEIIVRDIILSRPDGTNLINYSGASSFALWGGLTINAETQREWAQLYRQIVHEAGHNLLFGIARDQPLVMDDPSERRPSPIRADPRPMDGIFHAAFVSAREAYAFEALLSRHDETSCLSSEDAVILDDLLELSVLAFWNAVETLREEARLTALGEAVLADCEAYMSAQFAVEPC